MYVVGSLYLNVPSEVCDFPSRKFMGITEKSISSVVSESKEKIHESKLVNQRWGSERIRDNHFSTVILKHLVQRMGGW